MDRLIYTALSGMRASMDRQRVVASNMANANTLGFRAELLDQRPVTLKGMPDEARAMQTAAVRGADMAQGEFIETGKSLDIAIANEALMAVQAEDGTEAYTRRGDLSVSATGLLVNGDGRTVMGDTGPITIPPGANPQISPDGTITVANLAAPDAPPAEVGRIKLATWQGSPIAKGLDGLFRVEGGGGMRAEPVRPAKPFAHGEQRHRQPFVIAARGADQLALVEMRHLHPVQRAVHRGFRQRIEAAPERGGPRQVERLALQPRAQAIGRLAAHPRRLRRALHRMRGRQLAQEEGLARDGPAVMAGGRGGGEGGAFVGAHPQG